MHIIFQKTLAALDELMKQATGVVNAVGEDKSATEAAKDKSTTANTASLKVILKKLGRQLKKAQSTIRFQKTKESDSEDEYEDDDDDEFEEEIDEALQKQAMQTFEAAKKVIASLEGQISSLSSTRSAAIAQPEQSKFIFTNSRDFLQKLNEMQQMRGRRNSDRCVYFCCCYCRCPHRFESVPTVWMYFLPLTASHSSL